MPRKPNRAARRPAGITLRLQPEELAALKHNSPGPSGHMGGYQRLENMLLRHTDPVSGELRLEPPYFERLIRYCLHYGAGGPNARLRAACVPALRRAGIDIAVWFSHPDDETDAPRLPEQPALFDWLPTMHKRLTE